MRIAIATPVLYDKSSPFNHLFKDIIGGFLAAGNQVIRFVACRNEKENNFEYGYTGDNIRYMRYNRRESAHGNILMRYFRDSLTNIRESIGVRRSGADVLFEDVSYSSFWSVRAAKKSGMRVVAMIQDVWPDNAVQSGLIKEDGLLYRYFEHLQRYVYKKADCIICISDDMKAFIAGKGVAEKRIEVIYNWGYKDETIDIPWNQNEFVEKYSLDPAIFYAVYAGNIGKMQNVALVVDAARLLRDNDKIRFLIVGDGVKREEIEQMVKSYDLPNLQMLPFQPPELATSVYCAAGVNLIPLVPGGVRTAMPSKTGVVLSCGRPVIFAFGDGCAYAKSVLRTNNGYCVSSVDSKEMANVIERLSDLRNSKLDYSLFVEKYRPSVNIKRYVKHVEAQ